INSPGATWVGASTCTWMAASGSPCACTPSLLAMTSSRPNKIATKRDGQRLYAPPGRDVKLPVSFILSIGSPVLVYVWVYVLPTYRQLDSKPTRTDTATIAPPRCVAPDLRARRVMAQIAVFVQQRQG